MGGRFLSMKSLMRLAVAVAMVAAILLSGCGSSATKEPMAFIEKIEKGDAFVRRSGDPAFNKVAGKESLFEGDTVKTGDGAEAVIRFATGAVTRVLSGSEF